MLDFKSYYPGYDTETVKASIYAGVSNVGTLNTQSGYLAFMTNNRGTLAERMRIEDNGNVGIGTTTPAGILTINGSNTGNGWINLQSTGGNPVILSQYGLQFLTAGSSAMFIGGNGGIGIGNSYSVSYTLRLTEK